MRCKVEYSGDDKNKISISVILKVRYKFHKNA